MPRTADTATSDGFTAEERAAMKERAAELRAEGKKGAKKADGLQVLLDAVRPIVAASLQGRNRSLVLDIRHRSGIEKHAGTARA